MSVAIVEVVADVAVLLAALTFAWCMLFGIAELVRWWWTQS